MPKPHPLHGLAVPGHANLQFWGPNAYVRARIKVPGDVRQQIGKAELVKGLATQCVNEAVRRSHIHLAGFEHQIAEARLAMGKANARAPFYMPTPANAAQLSQMIVS